MKRGTALMNGRLGRWRWVVAVGWVTLAIMGGCGRNQSVNEKAAIKGDAGTVAIRTRRVATSVVQLIANPEKYDGAEARLVGFLTMSQPDRDVGSLHLNREDADRLLGANVEVSFGRCDEKVPLDPLIPVAQAFRNDRKYVSMTGRFLARPDSSTSVGVVCDISELGARQLPDEANGGEPPGAAGSATKSGRLK